MKDVFKIGIITLLLCISGVLFQYLGYGGIDYFIMLHDEHDLTHIE